MLRKGEIFLRALFFRFLNLALLCTLFFGVIPSVDAAKGGGSAGGTKSQVQSGKTSGTKSRIKSSKSSGTESQTQSSESDGTTETDEVDAEDDEDDTTVSLFLRNNAQHTKPELEAYLDVDDRQYTVNGIWTYYFDHEQMTPVKENGVGSQSVRFSLQALDPQKPHTIRVKFQGMVNGKEYASDRTILMPTLTTAWKAKKRQLALQLSDSEAYGKWLVAVRDSKQQLVQVCSVLTEEKLACDLSQLPVATYAITVLFSGESQDFDYAFKQTGQLDLQTGKLQLDEAASFPTTQYIDALHVETNWQYAWVKWNKSKVRSPYFPTLQGLDAFSGDSFSSLEIAADSKVMKEANLYTDGTYALTFYDEEQEVLHRCKGYRLVSCHAPEGSNYLLQFAGEMVDIERKKYPIAFEQRGTIQKGKIHVKEQRYIKNPASLLAQIDAAKEIDPEDEGDSSYWFVIIFVVVLIGSLILAPLFNRNHTDKNRSS